MLAWSAAFALLGCSDLFDVTADAGPEDATPPDLGMFPGQRLGEGCRADRPCREGLACVEDRCVAEGESPEASACLISDECADDAVCGWAGLCTPRRLPDTPEGCSANAECPSHQVCVLTGGTAGTCRPVGPQPSDVDQGCTTLTDCAAGLVCSPTRGTCQPGSLLLNPDVFPGVACPDETALPFGARAALPARAPDFYAHPFPSDARLKLGQPDLTDHPVPGDALLGVDPLDRVLRLIEADARGWALMPGIFFRFTRPLDEGSLDARSVLLVNLTTGAAHPVTARFVADRNKYICANHLYVHPRWGDPLEPSTPYAAIVRDSVRSADGEPPAQLDALPTLLDPARPSDADAVPAWEAFRPLRAWLDRTGDLAPADIAAATVFTTGDPTRAVALAKAAVEAAPAPALAHAPVVCAAGVSSPCATPATQRTPGQDDPRDCPATPPTGYTEVHLRVNVPVLQEGERPYTEGGGALVAGGSALRVHGTESLCVAISVPDGEAPEGGWPIVLYGHGTGGNLRTGITRLAGALADLEVDGAPAPVALMGFDQPMHGPRQGQPGGQDPGPLFFNATNPAASKGNVVQGAADLFALERFLASGPLDIPGLGAVRFDVDRLFYRGHSQGGTHGPLYVPFSERVKGAAFSGAAGSLVFGLLGKTEPYDATVGLRLMLQTLEVDEAHPALHLFQHAFEPTDPLVFAPLLFRRPVAPAKHVMHVYGRGDHFSPDDGQRAYAAAAGLTLLLPPDRGDDFDLIGDLDVARSVPPLAANQTVDGADFTGALVQFAPDGDYDGHFVAQRHPQAIARLLDFVTDLVAGRAPRLP